MPTTFSVLPPGVSDRRTAEHHQLARTGAALLRREGARQVWLFGSLAKGHAPDGRSDVDLAVEGLPPDRFLGAVAWLNALGPCAVDLVELERAPPVLRAEIARCRVLLPPDEEDAPGAVRIEAAMKINPDAAASLRAVLRPDVAALHRLERMLSELRARERGDGPGLGENDRIAAAYHLHNVYNALENSFDQISRTFENHVVRTDRWHRELLAKMFLDLPPLRPAVLPENVRPLLDELCGFRHVFRHAYGFELDTARLDLLWERWERGASAVLAALERFASALPAGDTTG